MIRSNIESASVVLTMHVSQLDESKKVIYIVMKRILAPAVVISIATTCVYN